MAVIDASSGTIQAFVIDHRLRACRADGQSMTETDWSNVYQHFQSLPEPPAAAVPVPVPPRIYAATTQPKPPHCEHCRQESGAPRNRPKLRLIKTEFDDDGTLMRRSVQTASVETPEWRRNGKIIWRTWPDGRPGEWALSLLRTGSYLNTQKKQIGGSDPQFQGTWPDKNLRQLCAEYHGVKGDFAYAAYIWLNETVFDGRIPTTLIQWALTPYGGCIGLTHAHVERPPVVTLHPAIWQPHGHGTGWSQCIPAGPRYTLDVILHELVHVEVSYVMGGHSGKSSHDCVEWCEAIMRAASRLKGTMLELPPFKAAPTIRVRENGRSVGRLQQDASA